MNPGNIDRSKTVWEGQAKDQKDERFVTFSHPRYGIRAMARILRNYERLYGLNTVETMISRWAPSVENNTGAYVRNVAKALGVERNQRLDLQDPVVMRTMIKAMIRQENGVQPYSDALIDEGIALERRKK